MDSNGLCNLTQTKFYRWLVILRCYNNGMEILIFEKMLHMSCLDINCQGNVLINLTKAMHKTLKIMCMIKKTIKTAKSLNSKRSF